MLLGHVRTWPNTINAALEMTQLAKMPAPQLMGGYVVYTFFVHPSTPTACPSAQNLHRKRSQSRHQRSNHPTMKRLQPRSSRPTVKRLQPKRSPLRRSRTPSKLATNGVKGAALVVAQLALHSSNLHLVSTKSCTQPPILYDCSFTDHPCMVIACPHRCCCIATLLHCHHTLATLTFAHSLFTCSWRPLFMRAVAGPFGSPQLI